MGIQKSIFRFSSIVAVISVGFMSCSDKGIYPFSYRVGQTSFTHIYSSPNGKMALVQTEDKKLVFLNPQTGQIHHSWPLQADNISLSFSEDGKAVYGITRNSDSKNSQTTIFGWDESNGTELFQWHVEGDVEVVGDRLFINNQKNFSIRGIKDSHEFFSMPDIDQGYSLDQKGRYFVTNPTLRPDLKQIWDGHEYTKILETTDWPVANSSDGSFLLFYRDMDHETQANHSGLFVWDLQTRQFSPLLLPFAANKVSLGSRDISRDGSRIVSTAVLDDHVFYIIWDVTTGRVIRSIPWQAVDEYWHNLSQVRFLGERNDRIFMNVILSSKRIWNVDTGELVETLFVRSDSGSNYYYVTLSEALSEDGSWYIGSSGHPGELLSWDFSGV